MGDELIFSYLLNGNGGGSSFSWEDIEKWSGEDGVLWIHLDYRSDISIRWLKEKSGISPVIGEALLEEETRPRCVVSEGGILLILRGVNFNPGSDPEDMVSLRMWFDKSRIISMRHRKIMAVDDIRKAIDSARGPTSVADFLVMVTERITDRMGDIV